MRGLTLIYHLNSLSLTIGEHEMAKRVLQEAHEAELEACREHRERLEKKVALVMQGMEGEREVLKWVADTALMNERDESGLLQGLNRQNQERAEANVQSLVHQGLVQLVRTRQTGILRKSNQGDVLQAADRLFDALIQRHGATEQAVEAPPQQPQPREEGAPGAAVLRLAEVRSTVERGAGMLS